MASSVHDVAAAVIERHHPIDPLKLQKIVYFAAGEYIALTGQPMFPEPIEAWDYGPVVHSLYDHYRSFEGERAILEAAQGSARSLNEVELGCVESALTKYGEFSGARLIDISHREAAWANAYVPGQRRTPIPNDLIRESFLARATGKELSPELLEQVFATRAPA